jgi:hypothetical protein
MPLTIIVGSSEVLEKIGKLAEIGQVKRTHIKGSKA